MADTSMNEGVHVGEDREFVGDLEAPTLDVSHATVTITGEARVRDYVHAGNDAKIVFRGGGRAPLVLVSASGEIEGELDAALYFDESSYEDEDYTRLLGALEAGLGDASLEAFWDDMEEDYEEEVDHLRGDGSVEDALDLLMGIGNVISVLIEHIEEEGDIGAMVASLSGGR